MQDENENNNPDQPAPQTLEAELSALEQGIQDLKVEYEQYFSGIVAQAPEKAHDQLKRTIKNLLGSPFKNSVHNYKLRTLRNRYNVLNTYWQRVLKQREEGTYVRDVFKANIRERRIQEEKHAASSTGSAERSMRALFDSYCKALESQSGGKASLDFQAFQNTISQRSKDLAVKNPGKKISFRVVMKNGKVNLEAKLQGT